LPKLKLQPS
jgi:hypothetical protein